MPQAEIGKAPPYVTASSLERQTPDLRSWYLDNEGIYHKKVSAWQLEKIAVGYKDMLAARGEKQSDQLILDESNLRDKLAENGMTAKDFTLFDRALNVMYFSEEGKKRKGKYKDLDFAIHQLAVAKIIADEGVSEGKIIAAALLHDSTEDTTPAKGPTPLGSILVEDLGIVFGSDIAEIVGALSKVKTANDHDMNPETMRNIFRSLLSHPEVILIKIADRLHSLRTIDGLKYYDRIKKAKETLDIYVKLAEKLGLHSWAREMAKLSLQVLYGRRYNQLVNKYEGLYPDDKLNQLRQLLHFTSKIYQDVPLMEHGALLNLDRLNIEIHYEENGRDYRHIQDDRAVLLCGVNIDSPTSTRKFSADINQILSGWAELEKPPFGLRIKPDQNIGAPSEANKTGLYYYRVEGEDGRTLVFEFATENYMRNYGASLVELYKPELKRNNDQVELAHAKINKLASNFQRVDSLPSVKDAIREFTENLAVDLVTVRDESGKEYTFPKGSTVLDLAYEIGSNLGNQAVSASNFPDGQGSDDGYKVNLSEPLIEGKRYVFEAPHDTDFVQTALSGQNYQRIISRFQLVRTEKAKEGIAKRIRKAMRAEARYAGYRHRGLYPKIDSPNTPLTNLVREQGYAVLKQESTRILRQRNIWPGVLFSTSEGSTEIHKDTDYLNFIENLGLHLMEPGGRGRNTFQRILNDLILYHGNMVRIDVGVENITGISGKVSAVFAKAGIDLVHSQDRQSELNRDRYDLIRVIRDKDTGKLEKLLPHLENMRPCGSVKIVSSGEGRPYRNIKDCPLDPLNDFPQRDVVYRHR